MRVRELEKMITEDGWYPISQKGSHRQYKHPTKSGKVTTLIIIQQNKERTTV